MERSRRFRYAAVAGLALIAAGLAPAPPLGAAPDVLLTAAPPPSQDASPPGGAALGDYRAQVASGGPGKDGIPAIDAPRFTTAAEAERFLEPDDVVFGVARNGVVRAYPQRILVWHEIVNDRLADEAVSITYCPLTGSALGFLRGETSFGVSGDLVNSNLIMYDRATDSRWPQLLGMAIDGPQTGQALSAFPVVWTTWARWQERFPDTEVLSPRTGHARNYRADPYGSYTPPGGYYVADHQILFPTLNRDERLPAKAVVIAAHGPEGALAFSKQALRERKQLRGTKGGVPYLAVYDPGLDTAYVYRDPPESDLAHERIRFTAEGPRLDGAPLPGEPVVAMDVFWFAWAAFYRETTLHE